MCRLLAYVGPPRPLYPLIIEPEHSLVAQGYAPKEMEVALLNADGFGLGWYDRDRQSAPFIYRNTSPIWNDINLPHLCRYIQSGHVLGYVRSATPGLAVDLHNCQPFSHEDLCFIHNGYIENFRQTLYRPIREGLSDRAYHSIHGLTDSEHIFALLLHHLETQPGISLEQALQQTLTVLERLASEHSIRIAINLVVSNGQRLVACRYDSTGADPSLYWLRNHPEFPQAVILASEPLFAAAWETCPPATILAVDPDGHLQSQPFHPADMPPGSPVSWPVPA
ncbi:ergothioneine biosynthesis protein EgtC [filamentous cyanobacterium CCP5]|nr:ergothioneine biosynthesis protein EgtC [filamentous cyanobacterium CCP5]